MTLPATFVHFTPTDWAALALLILVWQALTPVIERGRWRRSTYQVMIDYRHEWMRQLALRDPRIYDGQVLATLAHTATFFASACLIAVGGGVALLGQAESAANVAADIAEELAAPPVVWEIRILVMLIVLTDALLKFVWSVRLYGYQAVVMSAVPKVGDPRAESEAEKAAQLNIYAARAFNRGLRSLYFALAALTWLISPWAMILASLATLSFIIRREYYAKSRLALL